MAQLERPPYRSYAAIMAAFAGGLAAAGAVARTLRRDPQCDTALDFLVLSAAAFKAARTLSHNEVTSFGDAGDRATLRTTAEVVARGCCGQRLPTVGLLCSLG
jgi:hypothetical protein